MFVYSMFRQMRGHKLYMNVTLGPNVLFQRQWNRLDRAEGVTSVELWSGAFVLRLPTNVLEPKQF
jgi:hypothetical protein